MKQTYDYAAPRIEVLGITPEQGFAVSAPSSPVTTEDYTSTDGNW